MRFGMIIVRVLAIVCAIGFSAQAWSAGLADLSNQDTASGLKEALTRGAEMAVGQLGKTNGFLGDKRVRIPLPEAAQTVEKAMRTFGMKKQADELIETMNHAAETAVVEAKPILVNAIKNMSFDDARGILTGGDDAATQYFKRVTTNDISANDPTCDGDVCKALRTKIEGRDDVKSVRFLNQADAAGEGAARALAALLERPALWGSIQKGEITC